MDPSGSDAQVEGVASRTVSLADYVRAFTVASSVCVGAIWLVVEFFYTRFGLQPEDGGITIEYVLIRSEILVGVIFGISSLLWLATPTQKFLQETIDRGKEGNLGRYFSILLFLCLVQFAMAGISIAIAMYYDLRLAPLFVVLVAVAGGAIIAFGQALFLARATGLRREGGGKGPVLGSLTVRWFAAAFLVAALTSSIWILIVGETLTRAVKDGNSLNTPFLSVPRVQATFQPQVIPSGSSHALPFTSKDPSFCGLELGDEGGEIILYSSSKKIVIDVDGSSVLLATTTKHPC